MSYHDWLRELMKLPKTAEFCLADVTERISSGDKVINFLITEAKGQDHDMASRRGRTTEVCRTRIYITLGKDDPASGENARIEISEPVVDVEKKFVSIYSFSLHEFYLFNMALCNSVVPSLKERIAVIGDRSKALLESQLGDEVVKLVTKRLSGEDAEESSLKHLLVNQIISSLEKHIGVPVRRGIRGQTIVQALEVIEKDLWWEFKTHKNGFETSLVWKDIRFNWNDTNKTGMLGVTESSLCVRDSFLFLVNLPSFGKMVAQRLEKIIE